MAWWPPLPIHSLRMKDIAAFGVVYWEVSFDGPRAPHFSPICMSSVRDQTTIRLLTPNITYGLQIMGAVTASDEKLVKISAEVSVTTRAEPEKGKTFTF